MQTIVSWFTWIDGKKTYIAGWATFLYALVGVGFGQGDWHTALPMLFGSFGAIGFRSAIAKLQVALKVAAEVQQLLASSITPANAGTSTDSTTGTGNQ